MSKPFTTPALPTLQAGLAVLWVLITGVKLFLAVRLELYSDEIFYWQASQFPAWAYSDLPFMSALLAGTGSTLLGNHPFAVRSLFILMGSALPFLIYWLARPLTGPRRAVAAAVLAACLPMASLLGLLAVPDVPLIVFGLLFIGFFERVLRLGTPSLWLWVGLAAALGLSSHYRFAPYLLAALIVMTYHRAHWAHLRQPLFWLGGLIAVAGLYPAISFNFANDLSGLDYHLVSRHPWQFQVEGLIHPLWQALVVTPVLYLICWLTLWRMVQRARRGDHTAGLMACFAATNLGVYLLLAPWSDTTRTTLHWPLSGYLPLLIYMPGVLNELYQRGSAWWRSVALAAPALGLTGTALLFVGLGSQAFNEQLQARLGTGILSNKMAGWTALMDYLRDNELLGADSVLVTDNYYTAAQLSFGLPHHPAVFTIDEDKTIRDGRRAQYAIWQRDAAAMQQQVAGRPAVFITEDSTLNVDRKQTLMHRACGLFNELEPAGQLFLYRGDKRFSFYTATSILAGQAERPTSTAPCPLPALAWLDQPQWDATVSGRYTISGWAISPEIGVSSIHVLINGEPVAHTRRNVSRQDVALRTDGDRDPESPLLGFTVDLDTRLWRNGRHHLALELHLYNGQRQRAAERDILIRN